MLSCDAFERGEGRPRPGWPEKRKAAPKAIPFGQMGRMQLPRLTWASSKKAELKGFGRAVPQDSLA